jgi:hypothetical protein
VPNSIGHFLLLAIELPAVSLFFARGTFSSAAVRDSICTAPIIWLLRTESAPALKAQSENHGRIKIDCGVATFQYLGQQQSFVANYSFNCARSGCIFGGIFIYLTKQKPVSVI